MLFIYYSIRKIGDLDFINVIYLFIVNFITFELLYILMTVVQFCLFSLYKMILFYISFLKMIIEFDILQDYYILI